MENFSKDCLIISRSEYLDLKKTIKSLEEQLKEEKKRTKPDYISIEINPFNNHANFWPEQVLSTSLPLSPKLNSQLSRLFLKHCEKIYDTLYCKRVAIKDAIYKDLYDAVRKFNNLPWYKRIFKRVVV